MWDLGAGFKGFWFRVCDVRSGTGCSAEDLLLRM